MLAAAATAHSATWRSIRLTDTACLTLIREVKKTAWPPRSRDGQATLLMPPGP